MQKTDKKDKNTKKEALRKLNKNETPVEKALKLGNDEIIARAISDLLKRDDNQTH